MLSTATGQVIEMVGWWGDDAQELLVDVDGECRRAVNYVLLTGLVDVGDAVLLNTTAQTLRLGTGGYDFVISMGTPSRGETEGAGQAPSINADVREAPAASPTQWTDAQGHIVKARYTPCQHSVLTLEEQEKHAWIWERELEGMPVLAGQLHSQLIPAAAGLRTAGCETLVYIMTDAAALPMSFSNAVRAASSHGLIDASITCGQAFGGDYETVTLHSALLAAKHLLHADAAIVCQGPGNAGTGTRYGFSGIEQASVLDTAAAFDGTPIAIVRMSEADVRERHRGISHHTITSLRLVRSRCIVPLPVHSPSPFQGEGWGEVSSRHDIRLVDGADAVVDSLSTMDLPLSTMGCGIDKDRVFFLAAVAAGLLARRLQ